MQGKLLTVRPLEGIDERIPQGESSASEITNYTVHERTDGWDNRIGYERYFKQSNDWSPFGTTSRIVSMYIWDTLQGARSNIIFEADDKLYQLVEWGDTFRIEEIVSRSTPAFDDTVTTYTPFGRFLIILNGLDEPIRYQGWPFKPTSPKIPKYPLGFSIRPGAPRAWNINTDPTASSGAGEIGIWATTTGAPAEVGLGSATDNEDNGYKWKVSYVSNTGSESPISGSSNLITWTTPASGTFQSSRFVAQIEIPTGPDHVVARRIYRTKNLGDGSAASEIYYFVKEIPNNKDTIYYDYTSDNALGAEAPDEADSVEFPSPSARFGANFGHCLWIDGGPADDTKLYFSNPGKPDQFSALDFIDVGSRQAGGITGFHAYNENLLIFREKGIDIVTGNYPNFQVRALSQSVGTRATHSITTVPGFGVFFLAKDGVYVVNGTNKGGGRIKVTKISDAISETIDRMNTDVIPRSWSAYSSKWREWHCYFAIDGSERPNIGIVFHLDKQAWTLRKEFPVSCIDANADGNLIFGHNVGYTGTSQNDEEAGLFVISKRRSCGQEQTFDGGGQVTGIIDKDPCTSIYKSAWLDMGSPEIKKSVKHVYIHTMTTPGDNGFSMRYRKDYGKNYISSPTYKLQRPDFADQGVFDTALVDGTGYWEDPYLTTIRFDIDNKSCSHFQFEFNTTEDIILIGYTVEYTLGGKRQIFAKKIEG